MKKPQRAFALFLLISVMIYIIPLAVNAQYENTHANTGDKLEDLISVAQTQLGYMEGSIGGTVQGYNDCTKYGEWYGMNYNAWCAMFVSWCADQAEIPINIIPKHASCDVGMNWFKNNGLWEYSSYYQGNYTPKRGDIVYFGLLSGNVYDSTHVGIVYKVDNYNVHVIEGNSSNKVQTVSYNLKSSYVLGYGTPDYNLEPEIYDDTTYITTATMLNHRKEPTELSTSFGLIPNGTYLTITEISNGWGKTVYNSQSGWVRMTYCAKVYQVSYDANGGNGAPSPQAKIQDVTLTLSKIEPKRSNYNFTGWALSPDAENAEYLPGSTYKKNAAVVLYAVWEEIPSGYTVIYDANGGTNAPSPQVKAEKKDLILSTQIPTLPGYEFVGWIMESDSQEAQYQPGDTYTIDSDMTLYALWKKSISKINAVVSGGGIVDIVEANPGSNDLSYNIHINADKNYCISRIIIDGKYVPIVGDMTYYYYFVENIKEDHSLVVDFSYNLIPWINPFTDIKESDWFYPAVEFNFKNGYFMGISDNEFAPSREITRGMFVTVLYRTYEKNTGKVSTTTNNPFNDVLPGSYFETPVLWAYENNLVKGTGENIFSPDLILTREQMALILNRFALLNGNLSEDYDKSIFAQYTDRYQCSQWAVPAMEWATGIGIMSGMPDGTLAPQLPATRAQVAQILYKLYS